MNILEDYSVSIYEQSFDYNIRSLKSLMDKYFDRDIPSDAIVGDHHKKSEFIWGNLWGKSAFENFSLREEKLNLPYPNFSIGDELFVDDNIENVFKSKMGAGVVTACYTSKGNYAHALYFDYLDFTQPEFDTSSLPKDGQLHIVEQKTGKMICAKTDEYHKVYDKIHNCTTEQEIWDAIKGKCLKVVDIIETVAGRRLRDKRFAAFHYPSIRKVPVFDFVEKRTVFWPDYDPRFYYDDYKIVCDKKTNKWGIINARTQKSIIDCAFDDLKWGIHSWKVSSDGKIVIGDILKRHPIVTFYWKNKKAIYWIDELERQPYLIKDINERINNKFFIT